MMTRPYLGYVFGHYINLHLISCFHFFTTISSANVCPEAQPLIRFLSSLLHCHLTSAFLY